MADLVSTLHIMICLFLVGLVLLQQGKGADTGAVFGGGGESFFGAGGAGNILTKITTGIAILFFCTTLFLAISSKQKSALSDSSVFGDLPTDAEVVSATEVEETEAKEEVNPDSVEATQTPVEGVVGGEVTATPEVGEIKVEGSDSVETPVVDVVTTESDTEVTTTVPATESTPSVVSGEVVESSEINNEIVTEAQQAASIPSEEVTAIVESEIPVEAPSVETEVTEINGGDLQETTEATQQN